MTQPAAAQVAAQAPDTGFRVGTVTAINAAARTATVQMQGGTVGNLGWLQSYTPQVGDSVLIAVNGQTWTVVGATNTLTWPAQFPNAAVSLNSPNQSSSAASFIDIVGAVVQFTKYRTDTRVRLSLAMSWFCSSAGVSLDWAVQLNGVDYIVVKQYGSVLSGTRQQVSGFIAVAGGLAAGVYTVKGRIRQVGTAGQTWTSDTNDLCGIEAMEVR